MLITDAQLDQFRRDTPGVEHRLHFNNAGAALPPLAVLEAMQQHLALEARIGGYEAANAARRETAGFYRAVGRLLNAPAENIAFATSATEAYNKALSSVPFRPGDVILTTEDDYVSNQIAFLQLQERQGVRLVRTASRPEGGYDAGSMESLIKKHRPRLVAVTHIPTNSGLVQDAAAAGQLCRQYDCLYLLDACQSAGQMPLDVSRLQCDFLSATFRKFLRGPRGGGFLYVSDRVLDSGLAPLFLDLHSADWAEAERYIPKANAQRFETWERSYAILLGSRAAAEYALGAGLEAIQERTFRLAALLRENLAEIPQLQLLDQGANLCGIVTCHIPGRKPLPLKTALEKKGVNTSISGSGSAVIDFAKKGVGWALRLSPHYYNTEEEVEMAAQRLREVLQY
ncbi:MAG: aminotransferase class V-fold PLP-dependent enzyme [Lewinellaceae bacterium]|nr:aminotransferase class V-fold PLP-dependent enzyme [Lewinellaceae bacterium]